MSFYMHHVEREILSALTDGELSPEERRFVHDHLQECQDCREAAEEFAHIHGLVGDLPALIAPESFVSDALRPRTNTAVRWALGGRRKWLAAGVVGVAVAVTLGGLVVPQPSSEPPVDQYIARHVSVLTATQTGGQVLFAVTDR